MSKIINVTDFGAKPGGPDCTLAVFNALEACRSISEPILWFPKGNWHFYPEFARESYFAISNNTSGLKRCALPIINFKNLTVSGEGSTFIMHGIITGVIVSGSQNITLSNFSIDWEHPFYTQGLVKSATKDYFDVQLPQNPHWEVINEELWLEEEGWRFPFVYFLEFDAVTRAPAYKVKDNAGSPWNLKRRVEELKDGIIRVHVPMTTPPKINNLIVLRAGDRYAPGLFFENNKNIVCNNITVHHASGMGFIAQKCENMSLNQCAVMPSGNRVFSTCADATHFVNCRGLIKIEDSKFESQLDDPINIHGIYVRVKENYGNGSLLLQLAHEAQVGVSVFATGERVRFIRQNTLLPIAESIIKNVKILSPDCMQVTFDQIPPDLALGDCVENLEWFPYVIIRGCVARRNRARGVLITSAGKVLIEKNLFSTSGSAIKISGDANRWFESGQVRDILIQNNEFRDCLYCDRDSAVIDIDPEIEELGHGHYHHHIRIENNQFHTFDTPILYARSVDGLVFKENTITKTETYVPWRSSKSAIEVIDCVNVEVQKNIGLISYEFDGKKQ